jgi:aspartate carbamoyltransferase catalytic subunit
MENASPVAVAQVAPGSCLGLMFYRPGATARWSFEAAMLRIGGHVVGFGDAAAARAIGFHKQSLEDAIRFIAEMADVIVLCHAETDAAKRAAMVSPVPLISAGDCCAEHPTQSLDDLFHLHEHFGRLDGLRIGMVGRRDWGGHRSLMAALSLFDVHLVLLEQPGSEPPLDAVAMLRSQGVRMERCAHIDEMLDRVDAVTTLGPVADPVVKVFEKMPQVHYFRQGQGGVWMQSALLAHYCGRR